MYICIYIYIHISCCSFFPCAPEPLRHPVAGLCRRISFGYSPNNIDSLSVYIYIYIHIIYIYIYIYVCMYVCMYIYIYMYK